MSKILITSQELTDRYSVSEENFNHLVQTGELVPFKVGIQTFLDFERIELLFCNALLLAEMAAGLHHPQKPKRTR